MWHIFVIVGIFHEKYQNQQKEQSAVGQHAGKQCAVEEKHHKRYNDSKIGLVNVKRFYKLDNHSDNHNK
jgi:hypothetical protein